MCNICVFADFIEISDLIEVRNEADDDTLYILIFYCLQIKFYFLEILDQLMYCSEKSRIFRSRCDSPIILITS